MLILYEYGNLLAFCFGKILLTKYSNAVFLPVSTVPWDPNCMIHVRYEKDLIVVIGDCQTYWQSLARVKVIKFSEYRNKINWDEIGFGMSHDVVHYEKMREKFITLHFQ